MRPERKNEAERRAERRVSAGSGACGRGATGCTMPECAYRQAVHGEYSRPRVNSNGGSWRESVNPSGGSWRRRKPQRWILAQTPSTTQSLCGLLCLCKGIYRADVRRALRACASARRRYDGAYVKCRIVDRMHGGTLLAA